MEKFKHTPGPWKYWDAKRGYLGQSEDKMTPYFSVSQDKITSNGMSATICDVEIGGRTHEFGGDGYSHRITTEVAEANAKLIASAPDLLEALIKVIKDVEANQLWEYVDQAGIMHAISKATGQD